jgi:ribosomal-protein-alanine N-acetyltransferase
MLFLESERLKLIPLTHQQLVQYQADPTAFTQQLALNPSDLQMDELFAAEMNEALHTFLLPNTKLYPDLYMWYTNWVIILKSTNTIIGGIGFAGYPDDYGETLVGYVVSKQYQRLGYGSEALNALLNWGFSFSILKAVRADADTGNTGSQKVLTKAGFKLIEKTGDTLYYKLNKADRK